MHAKPESVAKGDRRYRPYMRVVESTPDVLVLRRRPSLVQPICWLLVGLLCVGLCFCVVGVGGSGRERLTQVDAGSGWYRIPSETNMDMLVRVAWLVLCPTLAWLTTAYTDVASFDKTAGLVRVEQLTMLGRVARMDELPSKDVSAVQLVVQHRAAAPGTSPEAAARKQAMRRPSYRVELALAGQQAVPLTNEWHRGAMDGGEAKAVAHAVRAFLRVSEPLSSAVSFA